MKFFIFAALCFQGLVNATFLGTHMYPETLYGPFRRVNEITRTPWLSPNSIPSMTYPYGHATGFHSPNYYTYGNTCPSHRHTEHPIYTHPHLTPMTGMLKPVLGPMYRDIRSGNMKSFGPFPYSRMLPIEKTSIKEDKLEDNIVFGKVEVTEGIDGLPKTIVNVKSPSFTLPITVKPYCHIGLILDTKS